MGSQGDIRAVFFDIGNVLLRFDAREVVRRMAASVGRHPFRLARILMAENLSDSVERGEVSPRELFGIFRERLGFRGGFARFRTIWCDHFTLDRGAAAILRRAVQSYKVYLLSNTNALHYEFIRERYDFPKRVHGAILSYKVRMRKPEPGIYAAALARAGVAPRQAVFIDDLEANVLAARRLGIRALRYAGAPRLRSELKALGLAL